MLAEERRLVLLQLIRRRGAMEVSELSKRLKVSEVTVRRDLEKLEKEGFLKRTYGGALSLEKRTRELSFDERIIINLEEKKRIGVKAASLIGENDTIFVSTGTTTMQIIQNIDSEKNLVLATNCLLTAYEVSKFPKVNLITLGGELRRPSYALVGTRTMKASDEIIVDKFFLGVEGISIEYGLTIASEFEAEICRKMIRSSKTTIIVADHSKFEKVAFARIAGIESVNMIIADRGTDRQYIDNLQNRNVKVIVV